MNTTSFQMAPASLCRLIVGMCLALVICVHAQKQSVPSTSQENNQMPQHASGPFDVKLTPQKPDSDVAQAANLGRMTIDKQFHGDLEAVSKGEMISSQT